MLGCDEWILKDGEAREPHSSCLPEKSPKEMPMSLSMQELALTFSAEGASFRKSQNAINRALRRSADLKLKTYTDYVQRVGDRMAIGAEAAAKRILEKNGLNPETAQPETGVEEKAEPNMELLAKAEAMAEGINKHREEGEKIALSELDMKTIPFSGQQIEVSIDNVLSAKQKDERPSAGAASDAWPEASEAKKRKRLIKRYERRGATAPASFKMKPKEGKQWTINTVMHVQAGGMEHISTGLSYAGALKELTALLAAKELLGSPLSIYYDGEAAIKNAVNQVFGWKANLSMLLDWHHLEDKVSAKLSSAMNNKDARNKKASEINSLLWFGLVEQAIDTIRAIDPKQVKNPKAAEELIAYLEKHREEIPCYIIKKKLGMRNSSNRGEKANDIVVSNRQKKGGMAWSPEGSAALAAISAALWNGDLMSFLQTGEPDFVNGWREAS